MSDDFFIGYLKRQPGSTARFVVAVSALLIVAAAALAVALAAAQDEPAEATFEYGTTRTHTGIVRIDPFPRLEMPDGSTMLLVAPFKHGADDLVLPFSGRAVTLDGTLIARGQLRMIEIVPSSIRPAEAGAGDVGNEAGAGDVGAEVAGAGREPVAGSAESIAPVTVRGEILDGKCHLGVMKPGEGTVHRACARLCLRGGIPALLVFIDPDGRLRTSLVTTGGAEPIPDAFLRYVGRPVELTGTFNPDAAGGIGLFTVHEGTARIL